VTGIGALDAAAMTRTLKTLIAALAITAVAAPAASADITHSTTTNLRFKPTRAADARYFQSKPMRLKGLFNIKGFTQYRGAARFYGPSRSKPFRLNGRYIMVDWLTAGRNGYTHHGYLRNVQTGGMVNVISHTEPGKRRGSGLYIWGSVLYNPLAGTTDLS
jgi:hypothetical protein